MGGKRQTATVALDDCTDCFLAAVEFEPPDAVYSEEVRGWGNTQLEALRDCRSTLAKMLKAVDAEIAKEKKR